MARYFNDYGPINEYSVVQETPDAAIPQLAYSIVDKARDNNGMTLFDGNLAFERGDLEQLKKLLEYNLPVLNDSRYEVRTTEKARP